jgi:hypothetical protein
VARHQSAAVHLELALVLGVVGVVESFHTYRLVRLQVSLDRNHTPGGIVRIKTIHS